MKVAGFPQPQQLVNSKKVAHSQKSWVRSTACPDSQKTDFWAKKKNYRVQDDGVEIKVRCALGELE